MVEDTCTETHHPQTGWEEVFCQETITEPQFALRWIMKFIERLDLEHLGERVFLGQGNERKEGGQLVGVTSVAFPWLNREREILRLHHRYNLPRAAKSTSSMGSWR